ncbi:hypothetical protein AC579_7114 [Pseudocercospora musae]|uniref:Uncharacterized protein n=1 Tax=Pseudocercospora musae TaxID=113226 RepID=A0A139IMN3_9PEZI|nr:hypothetical protein AC579_7114 [Pseudocercospora musae]
MILGAYRNPPYRSPTPRSTTSASPPPNSSSRNLSPKRKRDQELPRTSPPAPVAALRVDTAYHSDGSVENGQNSPRSKVAERLTRLDLRHAEDSPTSSQSPRKKLKRNLRVRDLSVTPQEHRSLEIPESVNDNPSLLLEVAETPGAYQRSSTPTPSGSWQSDLNTNDAMKVDDAVRSPSARPKRMLSPPPPSPATDAMAVDPFETSFDLTSLTWQDDEITGHEITSPDDDGEGINGIGFRPTPAIAQVRNQKRRQQVNEWKAREARDARQRRMDRRRGVGGDGASDPASSGELTKRHVRFMDSG